MFQVLSGKEAPKPKVGVVIRKPKNITEPDVDASEDLKADLNILDTGFTLFNAKQESLSLLNNPKITRK